MTNQEAIEILKDLWRWEHPKWLEKDIREALDMAIEALKNQTSVITELEKIKTEINEEDEKSIYYECDEWIEGRPCDEDYFYGLKRAIMIIDNHIFELKGEQMKFIAILDESQKVDLEEKGLIKESKPIFKEMLVGKDGQSVYITQEHLNCLIEYSQRKAIEQELKRQEHFFDDMKLFEDMVVKGKEKINDT